MDSLNRFLFALGLIFLAAGALMMFSSHQLASKNKKLSEEFDSYQRSMRIYLISRGSAAALSVSIPIPPAGMEMIAQNNQFKPMPYALVD